MTRKGFPPKWQTNRHTSSRLPLSESPIQRNANGLSSANKQTLAYLLDPLNLLMIFCTRIRETDQIFAHVENKSAYMERAMTFRQGVSGNPHGNRHRTRHLLNQEFMQALLLNFRHQGKKAIEKVARNQPAVYLKILALLVPREMKVEHTNSIKAMSDEQLEAAIEALQAMIDGKLSGESANVIDAVPEPEALPAPPRKAKRKRGAEAKASPLFPDEQGESE